MGEPVFRRVIVAVAAALTVAAPLALPSQAYGPSGCWTEYRNTSSVTVCVWEDGSYRAPYMRASGTGVTILSGYMTLEECNTSYCYQVEYYPVSGTSIGGSVTQTGYYYSSSYGHTYRTCFTGTVNVADSYQYVCSYEVV
jgi:hypothetical protein